MPKSKKLLSPKGQRTQDAILEATTVCIARDGIESTSITAIANEAEVSRGLVAHYFPVKSKMFDDVVRYVSLRAYGFFQAHQESSQKSESAVLDRLHANLLLFTTYPHYYKTIALLYYLASIQPHYRKLNTALVRNATETLETLLREEGAEKPQVLAELLHNQLISRIQKYYFVEHGDSLEEFIRKSMEAFRETRSTHCLR